MAIKVRSRWRLLALTMGLVMLALMVPAQGAKLPTLVEGNSTCASVGSPGKYALTINGPVVDGIQEGTLEGAVITLTSVINDSTKTKVPGFNFTITGGVVFDVIVKGSGANLYSYEDGTVGDTGLKIPNGNKLNTVHFCYTPGVPLACGGTVTTPLDSTPTSGDPTGSFTLSTTGCSGVKVVEIEIRSNNTIAFIPDGGSATSQYRATVVFTKSSSDDGALVLQYDPDGDATERGFEVVPDCGGSTATPSLPAPVPDEEPDSWCVVNSDTTGADYQGNSTWRITWDVYGVGDPLYK